MSNETYIQRNRTDLIRIFILFILWFVLSFYTTERPENPTPLSVIDYLWTISFVGLFFLLGKLSGKNPSKKSNEDTNEDTKTLSDSIDSGGEN